MYMQRNMLSGKSKHVRQSCIHIGRVKARKSKRFIIDQSILKMEKVYPNIRLWHE